MPNRAKEVSLGCKGHADVPTHSHSVKDALYTLLRVASTAKVSRERASEGAGAQNCGSQLALCPRSPVAQRHHHGSGSRSKHSPVALISSC
jgi:hypothetical protein